MYWAQTPGVLAADSATIRLDLDNEPQPDATLMIEPSRGGRARISDDDYIEGAPELVAEVASMAPAGGGRFLRPPRVAERRDIGGGLTAMRVVAEVAPTLEWLVDDYLVTALRARAGDLLATEPIVVDLDAASVERYQAELAFP